MPKFAFKFISGKYQGGEFPIPDDGELIIGRAADLDMVLVEDMVSRKHAKLVAQNGALGIVDLGSTNGTFVNGEKVRQADLKKDDRVLIGTNILKVVLLNHEGKSVDDSADRDSVKAMMNSLGQRTAAPSTSMSGDLEEVPLPDLLQLFATNKKTGVLTIGGTQRGRLYLKDGMLQYVMIQTDPNLHPMKAMCRMLGWPSGTFQFETLAQPADVPAEFENSTENVLIEAMRQNDEAKRLLGQLPPLDSPVHLVVPVPGRLADFNAAELDILQAAINLQKLRTVVDRLPATDHQILTTLQKLLKAGVIAVS
jgi:hypothetical protein